MIHHPRAAVEIFDAPARWAVLALVFTLVATGCTGGDVGSGPSGVSAAEVCAGTLDAAAQAALKGATQLDRFEEVPRDKFTLEALPQALHKDIEQRVVCRVYTSDDADDIPLFTIDFEPRTSYPQGNPEGKDGERTVYPIGKYAAVNGDKSAQIFFPCPTTGERGRTAFVRSSLSTPRPLAGESTADERMTVLNSVSRKVAERLGCAASGLPQQVPTALPVGN
ncbi:hypothetical protein ACWD4V_32075 [Streptomyces tsukubensis]